MPQIGYEYGWKMNDIYKGAVNFFDVSCPPLVVACVQFPLRNKGKSQSGGSHSIKTLQCLQTDFFIYIYIFNFHPQLN